MSNKLSMNIEGMCLGTYQIEKLVASASSGEVYQAQHLLSGRERVLLHCLNFVGEPADKVEELAARLAALSYVKFPGLVRVLNYFFWDDYCWVITDCPSGWPLDSYLKGCSPGAAKSIREQAQALVGYLHSYYGGYAHGSLSLASFLVGYDGKLNLIELGWLTGSFGKPPAMVEDLLALEDLKEHGEARNGEIRPDGTRHGGTRDAWVAGSDRAKFTSRLNSLTTAGVQKFTGTCPGCGKQLLTTYIFCDNCGYDLTAIQPCPLGLILTDQLGREWEVLAAGQLAQLYPLYPAELETALTKGRLLKWLRALGEGELVNLLESGLRAREQGSYLLPRLIHRVLGDCPGSFWTEPASLDLGLVTEKSKLSISSSLGFVYGKVKGNCGKPGLQASPQVFGGVAVELMVNIDRSGLAAGQHMALLELELNGRSEFVEVHFTVK